MEASALYHQPQSEYAYLMTDGNVHIRLRSKRDDVARVILVYQDPYLLMKGRDFVQVTMDLVATSQVHDYYQAHIEVATRRLVYYFIVEDYQGQTYRFGEFGVFHEDGTWPVLSSRGPLSDKLEERHRACDDGAGSRQGEQLDWALADSSRVESQGGGGQAMPSEVGLQGNRASMVVTNNVFKLPYIHNRDAYQAPAWVEETVWYQIFPERFNNGNPNLSPEGIRPWDSKISPHYMDFFGGDLPGITAKLDYLKDLGINGIYLCPIFKANTNHKYDTVDYFQIDPHFGSKEDLKELVDQAHQRGIRILFDAVFNHMGVGSPQWQDVLSKGPESKYVEWFHIHDFPVDHLRELSDGRFNYETFAFADLMPKLNTSHPEVVEYLLSIATYWIEEFDIDGWRLDVANEIDHAFWKQFHQAVTSVKEEAYILGEVWHYSQPWLVGDEFHAVMNYPLTYALQDYFIHHSLTSHQLIEVLAQIQMTYRQSTQRVQFNFLDTHDTARILHVANEDKTLVQQMLAFLFLQVGTPCIYYGTEVGLTGGQDPDCRRVIPWDSAAQDLEMFAFMQDLIALRRDWISTIQASGVQDYQVIAPGVIQLRFVDEDETLTAIFNNQAQDFYGDEVTGEVVLSRGYHPDKRTIERAGFVIYSQA